MLLWTGVQHYDKPLLKGQVWHREHLWQLLYPQSYYMTPERRDFFINDPATTEKVHLEQGHEDIQPVPKFR